MTSFNAVEAPDNVKELLAKLHKQSEDQEDKRWSAEDDGFFIDKFVALELDKSELVYLVARSIGATNIVEAGTSFGVSTIYLALAVGQNVRDGRGSSGKVIGTEKEPEKAEKAKQIWKQAGEDVEKWIEVRVGDLRETLKTNLPEKVDLLLLDIWTPLALPTFKLVEKHLRQGAVIFMDNVVMSKTGYADLFAYLKENEGTYRYIELPYKGGFGMVVRT